MPGSNLSADSGARPWRGRACRFALFSIPHMGWHNRDKSWGSQGAKPPVCRLLRSHNYQNLQLGWKYSTARQSSTLQIPAQSSKWVRFNGNVLNIKNKMASLSSIFPAGTGYDAGGIGLSREGTSSMIRGNINKAL